MTGWHGLFQNLRSTSASQLAIKGMGTSAVMFMTGDILCQAIQNDGIQGLRDKCACLSRALLGTPISRLGSE